MSFALLNLIIGPGIKVLLRDFAPAMTTIIRAANQFVIAHRTSMNLAISIG